MTKTSKRPANSKRYRDQSLLRITKMPAVANMLATSELSTAAKMVCLTIAAHEVETGSPLEATENQLGELTNLMIMRFTRLILEANILEDLQDEMLDLAEPMLASRR
jgi:hypothetical protein